MFEITRFELYRRGRGMVYISIALLAYSGLVIGIYPSIEEAGADLESFIEAMPPELREGFVGDVSSYTTIEGFLSTEMYQFMMLLILGMYFAYAAASTIAREVDDGSIDLLLVHPISRTRFVVGKYLSLFPVMVVVNAVMFLGTWGGVEWIGESIDLLDLFALHAFSIPYLLACASVGVVVSVVFGSKRKAQIVAAGTIFGMFLLHTVTINRKFEWLGDLTFARYYDPQDILVNAEYDWTGSAMLVIAAVVFVIVGSEYFEREDIS